MELLSIRHKTHGVWEDQADLSQTLKLVTKSDKMNLLQREALDNICVKIARIVCGDPNHKDHWDDIAGYATLGGGNVRSGSQSLSNGSALAKGARSKATRTRRERTS